MQRDSIRLAELMAALSLAVDLGMGQPSEHELAACVLSVRLGADLGLAEEQLADVYYVALLRWLGCTSHAHELSLWFADELDAHRRAASLDFGRPLEVLADLLRYAGSGRPPLRRLAVVAGALAGGRDRIAALFRSSCEVAELLSERLGLGAGVRTALGHVFERWDGRGWPHGLAGGAIALPARIVALAGDAAVFHRLSGSGAALDVARRRAGSLYDPELVDRLRRRPGELLAGLEEASTWEAALALEPGRRPLLAGERLDEAFAAVADFADLKCAFTAGHSRGVAALAEEAAGRLGLPAADAVLLRRAGLLHDLGRVGVPNGIWEKPGPLSPAEWERVRLHPYFTERTLARPPALARLAALAGLHHERLDGSGYHRGSLGASLPPAARVLACADAYRAMTEARPHRAALSPEAAAVELRREARAGRLDGEAAEAVLGAAGHRVRRRAALPAGLTAREAEVLRLLARGLSNREIAAALVVSPRTAEHHVQHVYAKIGVSTRAAAVLFALQHGLVEPPPAEDG